MSTNLHYDSEFTFNLSNECHSFSINITGNDISTSDLSDFNFLLERAKSELSYYLNRKDYKI